MKVHLLRKSQLKPETRKQKSERGEHDVRFLLSAFCFLASFVVLHYPLLRLPYYWDEAGYYIPAALDFCRSGQLVPTSTLPTGHTPLLIIYLALAWRAFGFSPLVTRAAMIAVAAGTLAGVYALGRRFAPREVRCWAVLLLAVSPLFFAQSTLVHLDLAAGLFTLLALLALLGDHPWRFALASTCAVLSKETAVVLLPVGWLFSWWQQRRAGGSLARTWWIAYLTPLVVLAAWVGFCHHATGFWMGNREYLRYNLYSTLNPVRVLLTLLRRLYETFVGGFNWLLTASAIAGIHWGQRRRVGAPLEPPIIPAQAAIHTANLEPPVIPAQAAIHAADLATPVIPAQPGIHAANLATPVIPAQAGIHAANLATPVIPAQPGIHAANLATPVIPAQAGIHTLFFLGGWLAAAYLLMLSLVGGAVLPRYLLPIFPPLVLIAVALIWRLPRAAARSVMLLVAGCFVWAWFLNPPYPFPFEDNLAYADFIRLHEQAAQFLEAQPGNGRILTAWPASDELSHPFLGYVRRPLNVVSVEGFGRHEFDRVSPESFDCLYLYSRYWEPSNNWLRSFPWLQRLQERYFQYQPQIAEQELAARYHLRLLARFQWRGQWVRIYVKREHGEEESFAAQQRRAH
jgi:4-amino-4-deoxy-L-arabinose transferase-like glycosyltransferase